MRKLNSHTLGRLLIAISLALNVFAFGWGGVEDVGASSDLFEPKGEYAALKTKIYDDGDTEWTYNGNWSETAIRRAHGGKVHVSNTVGDYAVISITGSRFTLIFTKAEDHGKLDVYVDDVRIHTVNQRRSRTSHKMEWTSPGIGSGSHVVKFVHASGKTVNIDAIKVRGSKPNPSPAPTDNPAIPETPALITPEMPNPIASPFPTEVSVLATVPSPTNSVPVEEPALTLLPDPTSSPIPSEVVAQVATSTSSLVPSPTSSSTPSQVPSPTASFTSTTSPTPSQVPSPTASLTPTITPASPINPTPTNTQIPTFTSTIIPTSTKTPTSTVNPAATSSSTPSKGLKAYYVSATGNNTDGKSWATAWTGLSKIQWSIIQPGDTIYVGEGTYNETVVVGKSGTASAPIRIVGYGNTKPVINGGNASDVFSFGSSQYVILSNVRIENGDQLIRMRTSNVTVDNVFLFVNGSRGVDCRGYNNTVINSRIETDNLDNGKQKDGIWSTTGGGHNFSNNVLINRNPSASAHSDNIQIYLENRGSVIANNFLWQDNTKTTNAQGIYIEATDNGKFEIYNNVIYFPYAKNGITIRNSQADATIIGNTLYQTNAVSPNLWIRDDGASSVDNIIIKNNIFYSTSSSNYPMQIDETLGAGSEVDGNLFYVPNHSSSPVYYLGAMSLTTWNSLDFVGTDYYGNPQFVNPAARDLGLSSTSPAIDRGVSVPYNTDIDGISRPQGTGRDIGAYEFQ